MTEDIPPVEKEATTPSEIASANSPFSGEPEPSPIDGMDMATFRNYLIRALDGDETVPASILTVVQRGASDAAEAKKKDLEFWERVFWLNAIEERLREIDRLIDRYNEMADWSHRQAMLARDRMREAGDKLDAIDAFVNGANDVMREKEATGKFDREKAIELLKTRGVNIDPNASNANILALLLQQRESSKRERKRWSEQYEQSSADATVYEQMEKECKTKAEELIKKREEILGHGYSPDEEAQKLKELNKKYQTDVQKKAAEIESLKSPDKTKDAQAAVKTSFQELQSKQDGSEADDFEALASGVLTKEFAAAASSQPPTLQPPTPPPGITKPSLGSPG